MALFKNQEKNRGSVTVIGLVIVLFFIIMLAAIMPLTNTDAKISLMNRDNIQAQLVAEAGAKRAIAEMLEEKTDWTWLQSDKNTTKPQKFLDDQSLSDYSYSVWIETYPQETPAKSLSLGSKPVIGQKYKITSTGIAKGAKKVVSVIYKMNAAGSIPTSAIYVKGNLTAKQALEVTGDIVAGGTITNVTATGSMASKATGMSIPSYNFDDYKKDAVELPHLDYTDGDNDANGVKNYRLNDKTSNFTISPTATTKYYVDGNLFIENNNLEITATYPAVIFVKNNLSIPSNSLKLTGHIMLISGGVDVSEYNSTNFENIVIVSSGNVSFKNNTTIVGILAVEGNLDFKAGKTKVTGNETLAKEFNDLMGTYELGGSSGTTAGEAEITNWKIE